MTYQLTDEGYKYYETLDSKISALRPPLNADSRWSKTPSAKFYQLNRRAWILDHLRRGVSPYDEATGRYASRIQKFNAAVTKELELMVRENLIR